MLEDKTKTSLKEAASATQALETIVRSCAFLLAIYLKGLRGFQIIPEA
jgi:hypothetical protein